LNTGSIAFYAFPQYLVDMTVKRTGGRPITVALPSLVDGEVTIDEADRVYLIDKVSGVAGSLVRRQTLLLQVMGDGWLITDNGRRTMSGHFLFSQAKSRFVTEGWNFRTRNSVPAFQY
jgi:hypothetical protein